VLVPTAGVVDPDVGGLEGLDILDLTRFEEVGTSVDPGETGEGAAEGTSPQDLGYAREEDGVVVYRPGMTMEEMEREAIAAALAEVDGNRRRAAELLGIGERTLYRKIRKFELDA
jgi:DNA-binding NtrC family response regulator